MRNDTYKILLKQIGALLTLLAAVVSFPAIISVIYGEWFSAAGFLISGIIIFCLGYSLVKIFKKAEEPQYNHALIAAASGWLSITLMGGLPFFIIAHITPETVMNSFIPDGSSYTTSSIIFFRAPLHCFFESMSAYTTTGLSIAVHEPSIGKGLLFYRSLAQWVGGAGFIVMALAVFKQISGKGAILLYGSESTGERLEAKVIGTARAIWKVYLIVTLFSTAYLIIGTHFILPDYPFTENIFDSINHAMAGQSTGGFSTLDDSIAGYNSPYMDMLYLLPMIIGSFSMPFFYKFIFERKFSQLWKDIQTRSLLIAFFFGGLIQSLLLLNAGNVSNPFREGIFQFISAMSTTGWQTSNIGNWDWMSVIFISGFAMFIGGASGATVGGIKMIRALLIKRGIRWQINKVFLSQNTVKTIKFNNKTMLPEEMNEEFTKAAAFSIIFFILIMASTIITKIYMGNSYSISDALIEASSAQGTVGLSSGITDPTMPPVVEMVYIFQMWAGRLEIIPVLALFRAICFGTNPKKI